MKEKLLTIILFLIFMLPVGMADNIFMPSNSLPYNIFKTVKLPYASHATTTVFQDRKGMIWIGTYHGICRYDGYKTTLYMTDSTRLPEENVIMCIAQLADNHLIVGTLGGLSYLNTTNGQSEPVSKPLNRIKSVRTMLVHGDELWIGTMAEGLWKYNLKTKKLQQIVSSGIRLVSICALCPVGKAMYVGSTEGLFAVNMTDNHIRRISLPTTHKYVISLLWHPQDQSLLVGMEGQMCLYRPLQDKAEVSNILSGSVCKSLALDKHDNLIVGTDAGLCIYNMTIHQQHSWVYNAYHQSICNNVIWNLMIDRDGNVWLATDNGVTIMENPTWYTYHHIYEFTHNDYGNNFTKILMDSHGNLWLGGENGLLKLSLQKKQVEATCYNATNQKYHLHHNKIRQIYEDSEHDIWIATDASIARYNPVTQQFEYYTIINRQGKTAKWAYAIYEDSQGNLWVGTYSGGLFVINKKKLINSANRTYIDKEQTPEMAKLKGLNCIRQIIPGDKGEVWLCGNNHIIRKNLVTGKVQHIYEQYQKAEFCNHALWLSSQNGKIMKYDQRTNQLKTFEANISDGPILAFVKENQNLWLSCSEGIFVINTLTDEITYYDKPDNMCLSGIYLPQSHQIIWGGENGFSTCKIKTKRESSHVYVTSVYSNIDKECILLPAQTEKIQLKSREYITFELSTLQYAPHQEVTFYYKLGDDDAWQSLKEGSNELAFAHISGGTYKLSLCSTNPAVDKNAKISTYYIIVPSPWYACTTAIFIYILIAIAVIIFIFVWYRRRSLAIMERHEKERSMELLRQKNEFFINMSHELKTPLSLIIAPLSTLIRATRQNAALQKSLTGIQKNALQLNQLIHKVLEFKNDDFKDDNSMIRSHIDMNSLVRNCLESFASVAVERNIQLNFHSANQEIWMNMDTLKMQSVITNLISNAIKFVKNYTGIIDVTVRQEEDQLLVSVEDNGRGIPDKDAKMIFVRFYQGDNQNPKNEGSGIGLFLVKKYVEMHGGKIELTSRKTTLFTISLPLYGKNAIPSEMVEEEGDIDPGKYTIIIVDDNREIVSVLREALSEQYNCIAAFDGKAGLEKIEKYHPSLIIADQMMPVMNGFQLVRALKHQPATANIPILMLTAKDDQNTEMQSIKLGVDIFLAKPFSLDKILLQVARLIDKKMALEKEAKIAAIGSPQFEITSKPEDLDEKFMEQLTAIIEENMEDEDFNVTLLADKLGYNQKQLYRKMKQITGMTPIAYIKKIRMKKAAFLMKDPRYTVTEIMYMVGYSNMSYFIKCFQAEFGMTPKKFLEK